MMRKTVQFLFASLLLSLMTTQCDVIDQPFKNGGPQDTTSTAQLRNVLIEDFTGHRCKNCPKASKEIEALVDAFGADRIIGLAIHAGPGNLQTPTLITLQILPHKRKGYSKFLWYELPTCGHGES